MEYDVVLCYERHHSTLTFWADCAEDAAIFARDFMKKKGSFFAEAIVVEVWDKEEMSEAEIIYECGLHERCER